MQYALYVLLITVAAPLIGGLLNGIDRKLSAHMQARKGPPLVQPFYDVLKLLGKERIMVTHMQDLYAIGCLVFMMAACVMLMTGQDLLMMLFVLAFGNVSLIMGAMTVRSPYSKIGAQREIIQMMAYEPVIIMVVVGVYLVTGSFLASDMLHYGRPLIVELPLLFLAYLLVLGIKLRKSPFDFSTSHHAHQELIKGITTDFSGSQLALIEIAHWYELVLLLGLVAMFFAQPLWVGILLALGAFLLEIVIDNITARVTWAWMLKVAWVAGLGMALADIVWFYI
jgi:ech hydrogenase subunit B